MGVFAVIGAAIVVIGLARQNGKLALLGALTFGIGVAGDINGL